MTDPTQAPADPSTSARSPYGERYTTLVRDRGQLCVGIDPHPHLLDAWGLNRDAAGLERCARAIVAAVGDRVAVFKPQSAFYEAYGSAGVAVLERVLSDIADAGALSLLDVKRGDIGSTMDAYATAYLADGAPLAADAITISPYLGFASLEPAIALARDTGRGVYVLTRTSNPDSADQQLARTASGTTGAQGLIDAAARVNAEARAESPGLAIGPVGLVVGATIGANDLDFSELAGSILAPGIGAQGASGQDLSIVFGPAAPLVLPSTSREIMAAGPDVQALQAATDDALGRMAAGLAVG